MRNPFYYLLIVLLIPTFVKGQLVQYEGTTHVPLSLVLKELKQNKAVSFLYEPETIANINIDTPFSYQADIKTILKEILPPVHLKFKKIGRHNFIIKKARSKRKLLSKQSKKHITSISKKSGKRITPLRKLSGKVLDELGLPLIGASILLTKHQNGTITDEKGFFEIILPSNREQLSISYLGYKETIINIQQEKEISIRLKPAENLFEEVVISALGFVQKKDKLGTASSLIEKEAIPRSGEVSLLNAMGGKVANVRIARTNGDPGAATNIRIRGPNTITGVSNPLIILDGIPVSNSTIYGGGNDITGGQSGGVSQQSRLIDLNPNNLESIQILKGASAAALWGSRAANGVIVLTSKEGKASPLSIRYESTISLDEWSDRLQMQEVWGQGINSTFRTNAIESWGDYIPDRSGAADDLVKDGSYFEATDGTIYQGIKHKNSTQTYVADNWDQVMQQGGFIQHDLSFSGGNQKATFFLNLGRLDQRGVIKASDYDRTNLRFNTKVRLTDWLNIQSRAAYSHTNSNRIQQSSTTTGLLLGLLRTPADFNNQHYIGTYYDGLGGQFLNRHRSYRRSLGENENPGYSNPGWTVFEQRAQSSVNRFILSSEIVISPIDWLHFTLRGGLDKVSDDRIYKFPTGSAGRRNPGIFAKDLLGEQEINFDAISKASFKLSPTISMVSTFGWNINDRYTDRFSTEVIGRLINSQQETPILNTANNLSRIEESKRYIRSNRGYGILSTNFSNELFITASAGLEAASTHTGTFFYPAIDAAWQFSKKQLRYDWLNFGKLRVAWGKVGIQPMPHRFETLAESSFIYSTYSDALNSNLWGGGFRIDDDQGNPDVQPEIKTEWEVGLDTRLFREKLSWSFTYYQNTINNLLFDIKVSPSSGFDTKYANAGSMTNRGFESEINYSLFSKEFTALSVYGNFSKNKNKVLHLAGTNTIDLTGEAVSSRAVEGYPLGVLYGSGSQVDEQGNFILNEFGFPQITSSPVVLGDPNPDWRGSIGVQAKWKKWNLHLLIEHSQGGDFSPRTQWVLRRFGTTQETANRITLEEDLVNYAGQTISKGTTLRGNVEDFGAGPVLLDETWYRTGIGGGFGDNQAYNFSIKDATFTRLRELSLSYTLDSKQFKRISKLAEVRFTLTGRNLFLWDHIEGIDPEINQVGVSNGFGLDYFTNPSTRSFLFSLAIRY